jgi:hypothetical protein
VVRHRCVLKIGDQYLTPSLELTDDFDKAWVIVGKRKAKKNRDMIYQMTNKLVKAKCILV